ncbi:50S ribosomal protein L24 [bacterium]|nr:50S ribosomal protein L24 [bacterium]
MKGAGRKKEKETRAKPHIRRDDIVYVIAGRDKGKRGKVLHVSPQKGVALVEGINIIVKTIRPDPQVAQSGGFVRREGPITLSNIQLFCSHCQKPTRIARKVSGDRKERICKRCKNPIGKA